MIQMPAQGLVEADARPLRSTDKRVFLKVRSDKALFLPSEAIELKAQLTSWLVPLLLHTMLKAVKVAEPQRRTGS
jgi:hypothetical protein